MATDATLNIRVKDSCVKMMYTASNCSNKNEFTVDSSVYIQRTVDVYNNIRILQIPVHRHTNNKTDVSGVIQLNCLRGIMLTFA